jgi:hypothetical protein
MPAGDLSDSARLAAPGPGSLLCAGQLAAVTAARLRLAGPLFGDTRPPGLGAIILAAAIGGHTRDEQAALLLRAVPAPVSAADLLAHHGLVTPAVRLLPGLRDRLLDASPLTGVLDRPGPRSRASCQDLLDRLRTSARAMVVTRFAAPPDGAEQAMWRGECLSHIRHEDPEFVLDVYETALTLHGAEHEIRARAAWRHVIAGTPGPASATALWWRALAELEAAAPRRIKGRAGLMGRQVGTNLFRRVRQMETP